MKKIYTYLAICLMIVSCNQVTIDHPQELVEVATTKVTLAEAETELLSILAELEKESTRAGDKFSGKVIANRHSSGSLTALTRSSNVSSDRYHVFNFEDGGFAVMAGDSRVPSLLVLTYDGSLNEGEIINTPGAEEVFSSIDSMVVSVTYDTIGQGSILEPEVRYSSMTKYPMYNDGCKVTWGQGDTLAHHSPLSNDFNYNSYCPMTDGKYAYAGCAAVALAQLISLYEIPDNNKYNWALTNSSPNIKDFNIEKLETIPSYDSISVKATIATLMLDLGAPENLNMTYSLAGSGANTQLYAPRTLENFGFTSGGYYVNDGYDEMVSDLKDGYPVIMRGNTSSSGVGHAWLGHRLIQQIVTEYYTLNASGLMPEDVIVNTYEMNYILCNFGWDGDCDGYYLCGYYNTNNVGEFDDILPIDYSTQFNAYNFNTNLGAIVGIRL